MADRALKSTTVTMVVTSVVSSVCAPTCTEITVSGYAYVNIYSGSGYTENTDNPGNEDLPMITTYLDGTLSTCDASSQCATLAYNDDEIYHGYDLHYLQSSQQWVCVQYLSGNDDTSYWNVANSDVTAAYGYCHNCG